MPTRRIEEQLEALKELRAGGATPAAIATLRKSIQDRVNVVVAKAAQVTADMRLTSLVPDLVASFERLFENPLKTDPQCWGKTALAKALKELAYTDSTLFLSGAHHIQLEPVWGGAADTATTLRGTCALALVQCNDIPRELKVRALLDALTDAEPTVRRDAISALEQMEGEEAILLLRLKARLGDESAQITGQALDSLLQLDGSDSVPFVASFLTHKHDEVREEAALSLGASRLGSAVEALKQAWHRQRARDGEFLLRAISSARTEDAIEFLLDMLRNGQEVDALAALQALELHVDSDEIRKRVAEALNCRSEPAIREAFQKHFGRRG